MVGKPCHCTSRRIVQYQSRGFILLQALSAQALCDTVVNFVLAYHGIMPQFDDVTLLVLKLD
jgi:serine phosphatase RsbU (regulator of sigma subunit)